MCHPVLSLEIAHFLIPSLYQRLVLNCDISFVTINVLKWNCDSSNKGQQRKRVEKEKATNRKLAKRKEVGGKSRHDTSGNKKLRLGI